MSLVEIADILIDHVKSLGSGKASILMNHGLLTVGQTVDEAAFLFCLMERSCKVQLLVEATGLEKRTVSDEEAAYNYKMASTPVCYPSSASESVFS